MYSARTQRSISRKELRRYDSVSTERNRRQGRHGAPRSIAHGRHDDRLSVLVRILARQAARERFEREVAVERETPPEVTLH
jgi:hypothetical protein